MPIQKTRLPLEALDFKARLPLEALDFKARLPLELGKGFTSKEDRVQVEVFSHQDISNEFCIFDGFHQRHGN